MIAASPSTGPTRRINGRHAPQQADDYDDYYDEPPRRSTGKVVGIVLAVVLALGAVGFFAFQVLSGPPAPQTVAIPALTGLTETDARNQIIAAGLRWADTQPRESPVDQKDKVIETNPPAGTEVDEKSAVTLIVGTGPASVNVPRLEGMTVAEATAALEKEGLEIGTQTPQPTSDSTLVDHVIESDPKAGQAVKGGDPVNIVVGAQQTGVQIPQGIVGLDVDEAASALRDLGLDPQRPDSADDNDKVSGTNPPVGSRVPPGSDVELLTGSSDGGEATMPNVVDLTEEQAKDRLADLGFRRIQTRQESVTNESDDGRVVEQSPRAGEQVSTDQQITLTIGDAPGGGLVGN